MAGAVGNSRKNNWVLVIILLCGIVLGGYIGTLASKVPFLTWLSYGNTFGLTSPVVLDLGILVLTFGLTIHINLASIIGLIIGIIVYRFI
ncbi:MAG: DUF4321 domain-containing protein [Lachnospiraceae bacterium]|nr:DUF4321 domain-containing protein [Lachnospiraceae bacterium]